MNFFLLNISYESKYTCLPNLEAKKNTSIKKKNSVHIEVYLCFLVLADRLT